MSRPFKLVVAAAAALVTASSGCSPKSTLWSVEECRIQQQDFETTTNTFSSCSADYVAISSPDSLILKLYFGPGADASEDVPLAITVRGTSEMRTDQTVSSDLCAIAASDPCLEFRYQGKTMTGSVSLDKVYVSGNGDGEPSSVLWFEGTLDLKSSSGATLKGKLKVTAVGGG